MASIDNSPLVSLIVRTKDRPKLLKNALKSITAQEYRPIEVVLVNDGGCDLSVDDLKGILDDVDLNYIRLEQNTGRAHAGNVGIENAKGEYIGFLDDDDELYPEHVSILTTFLQKSEYKSAYTDSSFVHAYYDEEKDDYIETDSYLIFSEEFSPDLLLFRNYIPFMCALFQGETLKNIKFDEDLDLYEDWDLLIRFAEKNPLHHLKITTSRYNRWDEKTQITSKESFGRESYLKVLKKHWAKIRPETLFYLYRRDADLLWQLKTAIKELFEKDKKLEENYKGIAELNRKVSGLYELNRGKAVLIKEVSELNSRIQALESSREQHNVKLMNLETYVYEIEASLAWKTINKLRKIKERVTPFGTKRRALYDILIKSIKTINNEGFNSFRVKVERRFRQQKPLKRKITGRTVILSLEHKESPVDIVLPVYNGYDYFLPCTESVLKHTNLTVHRLLIFDDKSPDLRIKEFLNALDKRNLNIEVFYNDENLGFVKTVNRGMKFSDRDVILLNSDALVTARWVEKLQRAAYSKPNIASVTPFSNNATLCSIPKFFENNSVPDGFTIDSFGEFIEKISLRYYPEIPSSVGFCNYIKREVLAIVGYFDEKHFEKGYAEECEFCARTIANGFIHILDDSTYIYHKGAVSFTLDVKTQKEKEHLEILSRLHPWYLPMANKFFRENPLKPLHDYINMRIYWEQSEFLHQGITK